MPNVRNRRPGLEKRTDCEAVYKLGVDADSITIRNQHQYQLCILNMLLDVTDELELLVERSAVIISSPTDAHMQQA